MNENTINERKKTDIDTSRCKKNYNTIALLRRAMMWHIALQWLGQNMNET